MVKLGAPTTKVRMPEAAPTPMRNKNHETYSVPGLQRGLEVLEAIASAREPLASSEIARRIGVSRSAAFRLVYTLRYMGFIESKDATLRFTLGPRVLSLGFAYLASMDILERARSELEGLRDHTNVSAHLAMRDGTDMLYLSCIQTRSGFLSTINVGTRLPAYATPMGWLLLSDLSLLDLESLYAGHAMRPLTEQTPIDIPTLARNVAEAASRGYVLSHGIIEPGGSSIAAPVFGADGGVVAAIDIAGPDSAFDMDQFEKRYLEEVLSAARRISVRLGHAAPVRAP
jgi:DNA-binding IclR family transcriptional regulator